MAKEPLSNEDPLRRTDLGRDAASTTLGDDDTGPVPGRLGPAPAPDGGATTPMGKGGDVENQRAAADSRKDAADGTISGGRG